jgi:hypothetical protein
MNNRNINAEKDRLNDLFAKIAVIQDISLQVHWAKYLAIQVSGFLETSLRELLLVYTTKVANPNIGNFVGRELKNRTNLKMEKLAQLLGSFSPDWEKEIRATAKFRTYKAALDETVDVRNKIAHGRYSNITFTRVKDHYENILKLLDLLESLIS